MFKLLIVDDEKLTRDSLENYVPWEELGINEVKSAKNGLIALDYVKEFKPDIILCDVRMPKMDGVEFATKLREFDSNCKIIFLSAFSDKEYLKAAIKLKAVSYIEKPIQMDELKTVLLSAVSLCNEEKEKSIINNIIENQLIDSIPFIREKIALDLVKGCATLPKLNDRFNTARLPFPISETFLVTSIFVNWPDKTVSQDRSSLLHELLQKLYNDLAIDNLNFIAGLVNNNNLAFMLYGNSITDINMQNNALEIVKDFLINFSKDTFQVSLGVGPLTNTLQEVPISYEAATKAATLQFYIGANSITSFKDMTHSHVIIDKKDFTTFKNYLISDCADKSCDLIRNITNKIMDSKDLDIDYVKNIYFKLLLIIFDISRERNLISSKEDDENKYIWQEIANFNTLTELSNYLISNITIIFRKEKQDCILNRKLDVITTYIQQNYNDKKLSVHSIANNVYLSHTYLCSFFKKSTNKTINEYITEVRISKAQELLISTNCKLYEITTSVGFIDPNYFSSIFKKHTGFTPTEYRERHYNHATSSKY